MTKRANPSLLQVRIIYVLTTFFLVALSVYGYFQTNQLLDSQKWVNHTNKVVLALSKISSEFNEATSKRRGYLLTGDSTMLTSREKNYTAINRELDLVDSLTKDNPEQIENLKILRTAIDERIADFKLEEYIPIQIAAELKLLINEGFNKSQNISEQISSMSQTEERLLRERTKKFTVLALITPFFIIVFFLSALTILWISYSKINKDLRIAQQLQTKVAEANKELEKKNEELAKGAERFLKIFDNSPVAMTFAEIETNHVVYANNLFYNYFGYSEEEVIGYTTEELNLTSEEENERLIPIIMSHLDEDRSIEELKALSAEERAHLLLTLKEKMLKNGFEILYTRKNGETFYAIVFVEVIDIANKKYSLTTYQDITERKEAQKQFADEKAFAELIIENDPSMIVVYDENLHIITWNKKSEEFSGLKKEEVLGKSTYDVFPEYNQEPWLSTFNSVLQDGKSLHFPKVEIETKQKFIESWLMPLRNTNEQIIGVLGITRDITQIIETTQELEKKNAELIEGSERYLKIFDNNPVAMAFAEIGSNKIVYANMLFYEQFGYTAEEVIGRTSEDLNIVSPEEKERMQSVLMSALQEERTIEELQALPPEEMLDLLMELRKKLFDKGFEVLYTRKNGTTFFAIVFYEIIDIGNQKFVLASYQDISEIKETQQQLAKEKAFAELVIENDPAMILAIDKNYIITAWNKKNEEHTHLKKEEVLGKHIFQLFPEYNNERWLSAFNSVLEDGKTLHYPMIEFKRAKGFGENWLMPLRNTHQQIIGLLSITLDITARTEITRTLELKNIELEKINKELLETSATLETSEERYHTMITEVKDYAILFLSNEGIIEHWNEGAERIKGYKAEEIIGKNFNIFYTLQDRQSNLPENLLTEAKQNGTALHEGWRLRKNGSKFWGSTVITALHDSKNNIIGFSKVTRDLTDKKIAEDKILESNKALEQKNIELAKINKELESINYISSHDLQEPLRQIQIFASRISDVEQQNLSDSGRTYFDKMKNAAKRMQNLISDLLSYTRTKTEAREFKTVNLNQLINEVIEEFAEVISDKNATIEVAELGEANVIPFQFRQMMYNLIGNALKFSKPDTPPHIVIKSNNVQSYEVSDLDLAQETEYYHISITDNGIGFEPQYKDRIFEVFQRLHDKQKIAGTGIGLAIVKNIVENHKGIITTKGELNKGATFDIYIPTNQNHKSRAT